MRRNWIVIVAASLLIAALSYSPVLHAQSDPARVPLTGNTTLLIAAATASPPGADVPGCGTAAAPCLTKNGAITNTLYKIDGMGFTVTISDPTCADPNGLSAQVGPLVGVTWPIYVIGNVASPCATTSSTGDDFSFYGSWWNISGFQIACTGAACNGMSATGGARLDIGAGVVYNDVGVAHLFVNGTGSSANYLAPFTVNGAAEEQDHVIWGGTLGGFAAATCGPNAAIVDYWSGVGGGYVDYTGFTSTGCTNVKYQFEVHLGGVMRSLGSLLPGSQVGYYAGGNVQDIIGTAELSLYGATASDGITSLSGPDSGATIMRPPGSGVFGVYNAIATGQLP